MNFLPDVYVPCEVCKGARYNRETLEVHYKGKTISEVLEMPIEEAAEFFEADLQDRAGTSRRWSTSASGTCGSGSPRRRCPAARRSGSSSPPSCRSAPPAGPIYVLDEPTTGLHFEDVAKLLGVLHSLVDKGNTVIVIEHNLDVIKTADWIIDMGPEGGSGGGLVVAEGTPEQIAAHPDSYTGQYLARILDGRAALSTRAAGAAGRRGAAPSAAVNGGSGASAGSAAANRSASAGRSAVNGRSANGVTANGVTANGVAAANGAGRAGGGQGRCGQGAQECAPPPGRAGDQGGGHPGAAEGGQADLIRAETALSRLDTAPSRSSAGGSVCSRRVAARGPPTCAAA